MKDVKSIIRNYRICVIFCALFFIGVVIFLNLFKLNKYINFLSFLGILIFYRIVIHKIAFNKIHSILFSKYDAPKYKEVIISNTLKPSVIHQINSALFNGEYQTVINLCSKVINGKYNYKLKTGCIACMARVYYEMGDIKNLSLTCNMFDEFLINSKKKINVRIKLMMRYYSHFISGEYKMCFSVLEQISNLRKNKSPIEKISEIFLMYNYGILCYKNSDFDNALKYFNDIIDTAPKLQSATLAQKYIDAINNSIELELNSEEILPQNNYDIPFEKSRRTIIIVARFLIVLALLFIIFMVFIQPNRLRKDFENKVNVAVDNKYDEVLFFDDFEIVYNEEIYGSMCAVRKKDGNYDLWFMVTYDNSETIELVNPMRNFNTIDSFLLYSPYFENTLIFFDTYYSQELIPDNNLGVFTFSENEDPLYLVVTDIQKTLDK